MFINYLDYPLANRVVLNDTEKRLLFYRTVINDLEHNLWGLQLSLEDYSNGLIDISKVPDHRKASLLELKDPAKYISTKISNMCDKLVLLEYDEKKIESLVESLLLPHDGDCVSNAGTCYKCYAEELLEIQSMPNYPGGIGLDLLLAFQIPERPYHYKTISEAIKTLKDKTPKPFYEDSHQKALAYLEYYDGFLKIGESHG